MARTPQRTAKLSPVQRYRQTGNGIEFDIGAVLHGEVLGSVPVRVGQTDLVSVRLGDLLALVQDHLATEAYARLSTARVVNDYVSFSTLRDAGIEVRYDAANDRLILLRRVNPVTAPPGSTSTRTAALGAR